MEKMRPLAAHAFNDLLHAREAETNHVHRRIRFRSADRAARKRLARLPRHDPHSLAERNARAVRVIGFSLRREILITSCLPPRGRHEVRAHMTAASNDNHTHVRPPQLVAKSLAKTEKQGS